MNHGWRGSPCTTAAHGGTIGGRCADCGKRSIDLDATAAAAWAASIVHWEQPQSTEGIHA